MTRAQMLAAMSSAELAEWLALFKLEHDEQEGADTRARAEASADRARRRLASDAPRR